MAAEQKSLQHPSVSAVHCSKVWSNIHITVCKARHRWLEFWPVQQEPAEIGQAEFTQTDGSINLGSTNLPDFTCDLR